MESKNFFDDYYFELLLSRITHSSMELEPDLGEIDSSENAIRFMDNMEAFKILVRALHENKDVSEELITAVADTVNTSSIYVSKGYRKIGNFIADTNIPISTPDNIQSDLLNLLYNYKNNWNQMDIFEREARFHIEFIRIHPFEDGNGRTGRLLLTFNLLKQNYAPVIITKSYISYYQSCIQNYDVKGLGNFFRNQSEKEGAFLNFLYQKYQTEHMVKEK